MAGVSATTAVSGSVPGVTSARTVRVGVRSRRQTIGGSCACSKVAKAPSATVRPEGSGT